MGSNQTEASLKAASITGAGPPDGAELDLYDELMSFTVLTPEQQEVEARRRESEIIVSAPQPTAELYSDQVEIGRTEAAMPAPQVLDPPRAASPSVGITRAATITVYKSPARTETGENSNQSFIVLDAESLLSEGETPDDSNGEGIDMLSAIRPLDVQISHRSEDARTMAACRACGYEADGADLFCLECGSMLNESASDEEQSATT